MHCVFHDNNLHLRFAPLSFTKPISELRMGMMTNTERWKKLLGAHCNSTHFYGTEPYLNVKYPTYSASQPALHINASVIPNKEVIEAVLALNLGEELLLNNTWVARKGLFGEGMKSIHFQGENVIVLQHIWDLFQLNDQVLKSDFEILTKAKKAQKISASNTVIGDASQIFLEEGAKVEASILNTQNGPIYIGKNAEIMEGCMVRGGLALMDNATLKMGAKVYGATTIGPHCKVGGEVSNTVFQAYSNKGHDGFLGNSVIGEWCNLGADTNSSNLKNNYSKVNLYSYETKSFNKTNVQFLGLIMGDHVKSGINTMFNTATTVGVAANVFDGGFPPKFIPSFAWGGSSEKKFIFEKVCEVAKNMMGRRNISLSDADKKILQHIYNK